MLDGLITLQHKYIDGSFIFLPIQMQPCAHKMGMEKRAFFTTYLRYSCKIYILCAQAIFTLREINLSTIFSFFICVLPVPHQITL